MKISKWEGALILLGAVWLSFCAGWFLRGEGAGAGEPLRVETERTLELSVTSFPAPAGAVVNINTASAQELQTLPGIGEKRALDIVADRRVNGPFLSPEDLTRVKGIGEATLSGLIGSITVSEEEEP